MAKIALLERKCSGCGQCRSVCPFGAVDWKDNRPELNAERFLDNPFVTEADKRLGQNTRIYATGDIVRQDADGNIFYLGRKDFQVKHNGNRIELGEIEVAVNALDGVTGAACIFDSDDDKIVLYYTTASDNELDIINLVKDRLPKYMFPNVIVRLQSMPHNMNGKVDRIALKQRYINQRNQTT